MLKNIESMKIFLGMVAIAGSIGSIFLAISGANANPPSPKYVRFYCGQSFDPNSNKIVPTTVIATSSRKEPVAFIQWKSAGFGAYTPERRCEIVSPKLQQAWESKRLKYLTSGTSKRTGQGIICGVKDRNSRCNESNMLFTLANGTDANGLIDRIEGLKMGKTSNPIPQSGGERSTDLEEFVEKMTE
jgi:Circadian oscillating protein COP23